jgi:hypothetical protein
MEQFQLTKISYYNLRRSFGDTRRGVARRITTRKKPTNAPRRVGVRVGVQSPGEGLENSLFRSIGLIYEENKEPTSGLEPLTC